MSFHNQIIPRRGRYQGKTLILEGRIPGTMVFKARWPGSNHPMSTCYLLEAELSPFDRILLGQTPAQRRRARWQVRWDLFLRDLAGADYFLSLNDAGEEFLYASRPRLARLLFPWATVFAPTQPLPPYYHTRENSTLLD